MSNQKNTETEYKYLISYPDLHILNDQEKCRIVDIEQTYLISESPYTSRVRSWTECGDTHFFYTRKKRISNQTAEEHETEISKEEYIQLLTHADKTRSTIIKRRFIIPFKGHYMEIDIYPFWTKQAVLEVEISKEDEYVEIPPYVTILKDVTGDKQYKNYSLALYQPSET